MKVCPKKEKKKLKLSVFQSSGWREWTTLVLLVDAGRHHTITWLQWKEMKVTNLKQISSHPGNMILVFVSVIFFLWMRSRNILVPSSVETKLFLLLLLPSHVAVHFWKTEMLLSVQTAIMQVQSFLHHNSFWKCVSICKFKHLLFFT